MTFKPASSRRNTNDARGRVRIQVTLFNPKERKMVKGNVTRVVSVENAKVSEVTEIIKANVSTG